jgi:predicted DNA-binding transcriptional regulator
VILIKTIVDKLKSLYFSEIEATIYVYLLQNPGQTMYQITTGCHLTKLQTVDAVENMVKKGVLLLENGVKDLYYSEKPTDLLNQLKTQYIKQTDMLVNDLTHLSQNYHQEPYLNYHGYDDIIGQARTMIYEAKEDIYINTDLDISLFDDEQKGVDIFIFSFRAQTSKRMNVSIFSHEYDAMEPTRLMMVVDMKKVMIANRHPLTHKWSATTTKNELMINIITEHIHHDMYLYKIKKTEQKHLFELYPDLFVGTQFEKRRK